MGVRRWRHRTDVGITGYRAAANVRCRKCRSGGGIRGIVVQLSYVVFLSLAAKRGFIIDEYTDAAIGKPGMTDDGKMAMTRVVLKPNATWSGDNIPNQQQTEKMHHRAHDLCFIANSVKSEVVIEIVA